MKIDLPQKPSRKCQLGDVLIVRGEAQRNIYLKIIRSHSSSSRYYKILDLKDSCTWSVEKSTIDELLDYILEKNFNFVEVIPHDKLVLSRLDEN